jgi:hypothetical protein
VSAPLTCERPAWQGVCRAFAETIVERLAETAAGRERWYRERIARVLELLETGDAEDRRIAVETVLYALDGPEPELKEVCRACGARFPWRGLLEKHELVDCPALWETRRAA